MKLLQDYIHGKTDHFQGHVQPEFLDLAKQFSKMQSARVDQGGAGLCVYFQGEKVLDIYTGKKSADENWQADTLSVCYSTGKGVLATLAHVLVSEGLLTYDTPVAEYWPEFAQHGKERITLAHMLSHQSGLFDIRHMIDDAREMANWDHMLERLADAKPRFDVGTDYAYQPFTFGWQVGGVLEKATGERLETLMQRYLVEPLGLDGAYFGVPSSELDRVARLIPKARVQYESSQVQVKKSQNARKPSLMDRALEFTGQNPQDFQDAMIPKGMKHFSFFSDEGLQAVIPAASGIFSASSLATIYAMLANGGEFQGQIFIRPEVFARLSQIQYKNRDRVMPLPMHWRLGYHRILTLGKASNGFGHMGFNGSGAWCDPERNLSFAYTHNFATGSITGDYRLWGLSQEAIRCADAVLKGRKGWF